MFIGMNRSRIEPRSPGPMREHSNNFANGSVLLKREWPIYGNDASNLKKMLKIKQQKTKYDIFISKAFEIKALKQI